VIEHALHERLTIVERAFDRQRMDIVVGRRRHHPPLHVGDATARKEREEVNAPSATKCLDGGPPCIARGSNHDRGALATRREHLIHQPPKELHRQVFEREGRPMKQLKDKIVRPELDERRDRRMAEAAIRLARQATEVVLRDGLADEQPHDLGHDFRVRASGKTGNRRSIEPRPGRRNIQAAIVGQSCQRDFDKAKRRGLASG
jgi:hypothetical protein